MEEGRGIKELLDDQRHSLFSLFFNNFFGFGNFSKGEVEHGEDTEGERDKAGIEERESGVFGHADTGVRGVIFFGIGLIEAVSLVVHEAIDFDDGVGVLREGLVINIEDDDMTFPESGFFMGSGFEGEGIVGIGDGEGFAEVEAFGG